MATYSIIKLKNLTPLHIGTGKEHYDFSTSQLHSDTISAALASLLAQQGKTDDVKEFLNSFTISSALPFCENMYFFPKMQGKINVKIEGKEDYEYRKKLKKIHFVEFSLWQKLINGEIVTVKDEQLQNKFLLAPASKFKTIYKSQVNQRVAVPRDDGQDAEPFFFEWTFFTADSGLFCMTDASGALLDEIKRLFELLGQTGLGTDKNVGGGKFEVETDSLTLANQDNANAAMLLSLYIPDEEEVSALHLRESRFDLLLRGGYIAGSIEENFRHLRKKSVYMFGVGSVFPTRQKLSGKVIDLRPEWHDDRMHAVFRSGRPFFVPIKYDAT